MAELSDIEEGCSGGASEQNGKEYQAKKDGGDHAWNGRGKGKGLQRQSHEFQPQYENSPVSITIIPPSLPPSSSASSASSSSSRTITPPDSALSPQRVSSSGTVQIASPEASSVTARSQTESSAWSPVSGPSRIYGITSETASSSTIAGHHYYGDALWKDEDGGLVGIPGSMLRSLPSLTTTFVLFISFVTLLIHEIYVLSPVVLLYLQAAILALTTVSATTMWMNCVQEDNVMLKCALISCSIMFWGMSGLAFLRAVVVWKVTSLDEDEASE
ncbi:hypothetical protein TrVGV298_003896 [Trichoderma virens]|nr:hypothetical protein TrVGV298_003896 [Trichoderma virens]